MDNNQRGLSHTGVLGMKWGVRRAGNAIKSRVRETTKYTKNSYLHPFLTGKAERQSMDKNSFGTIARRSLVYQKTSEIKDINTRVNKMLAKKAKIKQIKTEYRKEYMRGESAAGKVFAKVTGSDKIYANTMYDLNKK